MKHRMDYKTVHHNETIRGKLLLTEIALAMACFTIFAIL